MNQAIDTTPRRGGSSFVLPILLVGVGMLMLLANLGVLPALSWRTVWQLWPVLLIVIGLDLLLTGRISWAAIWFGVLLAMVVATVLTSSGVRLGSQPTARGAPPLAGQRFEQSLSGATRADVKIDHGAGQLTITDDAATGLLAEGQVAADDDARVAMSYRVADGTGVLTLAPNRHTGPGWLFGLHDAGQDMTVQLSNTIPIRRLEVNTGAADARLELTHLQIQRLELNTGASSAEVCLPAQGQVTANVSAGATGLTIRVPPAVAARIRVDGGLSGAMIDQQRFPVVRQEGIPGLGSSAEYRSLNYDSAPNRVDLRISVGASGVDVR